MKIKHYTLIPSDPAGEEDAEGVSVRWVISQRDGADNFSMRVIAVEPGGHTPCHDHPWEHEVFVLSGLGVVRGENGETPITAGTAVFVEPNEIHCFTNSSDEVFRIICVIPTTTDGPSQPTCEVPPSQPQN